MDNLHIIYFMTSGYFVLLAMFGYYAWLNVKQTKTIEEWNDKTDSHISAIRERNLELEKKVRLLEKRLDDISVMIAKGKVQ